jgi:hypothetical protein
MQFINIIHYRNENNTPLIDRLKKLYTAFCNHTELIYLKHFFYTIWETRSREVKILVHSNFLKRINHRSLFTSSLITCGIAPYKCGGVLERGVSDGLSGVHEQV